MYLANEGSGLAFFSTDLGHIFGSIVGKGNGVMLKEKRSHKSKFAHDLGRIQSRRLYRDLIEYNIYSLKHQYFFYVTLNHVSICTFERK